MKIFLAGKLGRAHGDSSRSRIAPEDIQCITGSGGEIGDALVVRKVTFTGSREISDRICHMAGIKSHHGAWLEQSGDHASRATNYSGRRWR